MLEDYQKRFNKEPFDDEISETQHSKWQEMGESTDFTYSSRTMRNELLGVIKALKNNKAADLYIYMTCSVNR